MATKTETSGMEAFGIFSALMLLMALNTIAFGYVIATLWGWFVVPTFHVAPLSIAVAAGIDTLVLALRPPPASKTDDIDVRDVLLKGFGRIIGLSLFLLGLGWAIRCFV